MPINKDRSPGVPMDEDTLKRAEEMCSGLSLSVSVERRQQTGSCEGMLDDLNELDRRPRKVTVVGRADQPALTLICSEAMGACCHALLVVRPMHGRSRKLLGRHGSSLPGRRVDDGPQTHWVEFAVERVLEE